MIVNLHKSVEMKSSLNAISNDTLRDIFKFASIDNLKNSRMVNKEFNKAVLNTSLILNIKNQAYLYSKTNKIVKAIEIRSDQRPLCFKELEIISKISKACPNFLLPFFEKNKDNKALRNDLIQQMVKASFWKREQLNSSIHTKSLAELCDILITPNLTNEQKIKLEKDYGYLLTTALFQVKIKVGKNEGQIYDLLLKNLPRKLDLSIKLDAILSFDHHSAGFEFLPERLKKDRDVILISLKRDRSTLCYTDKSLMKDKEFVLAAVNQNGGALYHADECLRKDKEVVLTAVKQDGYALEYAYYILKNDKDVVMAAIEQNSQSIRFADVGVRRDLSNNSSCNIL